MNSEPSRVDRPTDDALWRCVADTLQTVILPALRPGFERDSARQLTGVARYALSRPPDRGAERARELAGLLDLPAETSPPQVLEEASRALVSGDAPVVRARLLGYLTEDFEEAAPLLETFSGHDPAADEPDVVAAPEAADLGKWLAQALDREIEELDVAVMVGGHSRRMLSVSVTTAGIRQDLVVRIEQGGMFGTEGEPEARVMRALSESGFPAPPVRWIEADSSVLGQPFFVMDRVPGSPAVDDAMLDAYIRKLHELHELNPGVGADGLGPVPAAPQDAVSDAIDHWRDVYRRSAVAPIPLLEEAADWLHRNLRPTGPVSIVHGDPGPGNFLHNGAKITAFTDWEFAHYGDAAEDWTYFGAIRARKITDAPGWRAKFAAQAGVSYDDETWGRWEAFNLFKGACANLSALRLFRDGVSTAPNLLAIGTAVHLRFLKQLVERIDELSARSGGRTAVTESEALRDKQAIAEVCYRYAFALDARDWTTLQTCFTADATAYYRDQNPSHGYPAIEMRIRSALAALSSTQHLIGNVLVTLAGDEADSVCYLQAQHVRPGTDGGDTFIIAGRYLDRFVRTPDGWRIAQRRLEALWTDGNPAVTAR